LAIDARLAYIENEILQADPIRLVQALYRGAIEAVEKARVHLRANDIRARSAQITKASEIISELTLSLDRERGGEIAVNLAELYDYMQRRLQEANFRQEAAPLEEIERLLSTLLEAWLQVRPLQDQQPSAAAPTPKVMLFPSASLQPSQEDGAGSYAPGRLASYSG
jgi:flagellar secretion chaperone FliS